MARLILMSLWMATVLCSGVHAGEPVRELSMKVGTERAFPNLEFERPVVVTHAGDGSNRIFVAEQEGVIRVFANDQEVEESAVFLDIDERCVYADNQNEEGLLGLAFHPNFSRNGEFFVYYNTSSAEHVCQVSRFRVSQDNPAVADPNSEEVILKIPQPFWNHNGGTIAFGPDGFLYVGLGDGGSGNDPNGNGQNLTTILGAILRIDVDHKSDGLNYAIPTDNPFIGTEVTVGRAKDKIPARPEIFAYGFRNVWRLSFDSGTGDLWAADVGQNLWEEINIVRKGGNYGWNIREARHWFRPDGKDSEQNDLVDPIHEYDHETGKSVTGGEVYRGKRVAELAGKYVYGDYVSGKLWALEYDREAGVAKANYSLESNNLPVMSFGSDETGDVYFTTPFGMLFRFVTTN